MQTNHDATTHQGPTGDAARATRRVAWIALAMAAAFTAVGCAPEDGTGEFDTNVGGLEIEEAYPGESGAAAQGMFVIEGAAQMLEYQVINNEMVFEGDIILGSTDPAEVAAGAEGEPTGEIGTSTEALAARNRGGLWPNGVVYYTIDSRLPNQQRVTDAIAHWQRHTPLRFVRRTNQAAYVTFTPGSGCSSSVGRTGRQQFVRLARGCGTGSTIHEIGHAVGLWHEQSRSDRNEHVRIIWDNIESGHRHNFQTYRQQRADGRDVGAYDTGSIMHYGSYYFSRNGRPTITTLSGGIIRPNRSGLSARDIAGIDRIY